ncbi:MBL fold metallo-hydrolase [Glutamicibacter sp. X7]
MDATLQRWQCATCATEFDPAHQLPQLCPICADERQYVPDGVQRWVTAGQLLDAGHRVRITGIEPRLYALDVEPAVGIGQRAKLVCTEGGNLLFDVPPVLDDKCVARLRELGGVAAIVASHPHMYGVQSAYSAAFDDAPVYVAAVDAHWVQFEFAAIRHFDAGFEPLPGLRLEIVGGHFPGSTVALWADGAEGRGVLLAGDAIFPVADGNVTFLRSYPNRIPLSGPVVRRIAAQVTQWDFDRLYNNFTGVLPRNARRIIGFSAERYARWAEGANDHLT